ncbi:MAG TPA: DUF1326 domain-containing protein [Bryobacteraceae bacterium]|nr:DUF1326 domain-containing protein [Bryobacteraceae bacterium]
MRKFKWSMKGTLLGACSCDWGCPCSFDAPPTRGFCEGVYLWHIEEGEFGYVRLNGLTWAWCGKSPAAMHLGNVTGQTLIDARADPRQRAALEAISQGKSGGPWTIFTAVMSRRLPDEYVPFDLRLDGLNSTARAPEVLDMQLGPILNPVTGAAEELYLDKPTGFTSHRVTLGASRVFKVNAGLHFDHSGKYGEFSHFEYSGESPD